MKFKFIALVFFLASQSSLSIASAKKLHDSKCLSCHSTSVYSRADRKVQNFNALSQRVNMCVKGGARANWDKEQINSVTDYLNKKYYKF